MGWFLFGKLRRLVLVLFAISVLSFMLFSLLPGDPAVAILNSRGGLLAITPEALETLREDLGTDRPLPERYVAWLSRILSGDLGRSYDNDREVSELVLERIPVTLEIGLLAIVIALAGAIPIGVLMASRSGSYIDGALSGVMFGLLSVPEFVVAIILLSLFVVTIQVFPAAGWVPITVDPIENLRHAILPSLALAIPMTAIFSRLLRSDMITTLQQDFVVAAQAKGMSTQRILFAHALRPSLGTLMTVVAIEMGTVLGGTALVETVFAAPGLGSLMVGAAGSRDLFVVQALVLIFGVVFVFVNVLADILYAVLDPRIQVGSVDRG